MTHLTETILKAGVENVRFKLAMSRVHRFPGTTLGFVSRGENEKLVDCFIDEKRYKVEDDFKITLRAEDPNYGYEHFYLMDLNTLVRDGTVQMEIKE